MPKFTVFSEKSFFFKKIKNLKYGGSMCSDAIALIFSRELDSTDGFMWVLERLDF